MFAFSQFPCKKAKIINVSNEIPAYLNNLIFLILSAFSSESNIGIGVKSNKEITTPLIIKTNLEKSRITKELKKIPRSRVGFKLCSPSKNLNKRYKAIRKKKILNPIGGAKNQFKVSPDQLAVSISLV